MKKLMRLRISSFSSKRDKETASISEAIKSFNKKGTMLADYHTPVSSEAQKEMLKSMKIGSLSSLQNSVYPKDTRTNTDFTLPPKDIYTSTQKFKTMINRNQELDCYIGEGFYPCFMPPTVRTSVFCNPKWYTAYTPYQAEISQGRLESLFNYQIMIKRLTEMEVANASLLCEASAAGEAVLMAFRLCKNEKKVVLVDEHVFKASREVIETVSHQVGIKVLVGHVSPNLIEKHKDEIFAVVSQNPCSRGQLKDLTEVSEAAHGAGALSIVGTDLLACVRFRGPGSMGADIVYGNGQRFGVPMGFGGPHAAFFAFREGLLRQAPGRIISRSVDVHGNLAYRMALQTREQHIKREKATSNICTSQVLLANINFFYALFHGEEGLKKIAEAVHKQTLFFASILKAHGYEVIHERGAATFGTVCIKHHGAKALVEALESARINVRLAGPSMFSVSFDETKTGDQISKLVEAILKADGKTLDRSVQATLTETSRGLFRESLFKPEDIFNHVQGEHELLRYITRLENKDVSLNHSMITLGSCTMKLNSAYEMAFLTDPKLHIHPYVPLSQAKGYMTMLQRLSDHLLRICDMDAISYQPNSGATGEYTGLLAIKQYFDSKGQHQRTKILIPSSAHGTNPASASKMGLEIVTVKTEKNGYVSVEDLAHKLEEHRDEVFGLMITYPSTSGIFEEDTVKIIKMVHDVGGQVYIDCANMNAQLLHTSPGFVGGDICHLNLHKTFCIPHGGGGPGIGPVLCRSHLAPFLPSHPGHQISAFTRDKAYEPKGQSISSAPFSSALILSIPYLFIEAMGKAGIKGCASQAILSANYLAKRLSKSYKILFSNHKGFVAHEFIIDFNELKKEIGISAEDVAKRLMDYGFHAPTMSFPVSETLMIEPTESENINELNRFAEALESIRKEIDNVKNGVWKKDDNPLKNAPHTLAHVAADEWNHCYSREVAGYPLPYLRERAKVWPAVGRINNTVGDRNLAFENCSTCN